MALAGRREFGSCGHGAQIVTNIVSVTISPPDFVDFEIGVPVLAVVIHHVGGPVEQTDGLFFARRVAGLLGIFEFDGRVARGMALTLHTVGGLFGDDSYTVL